MVQEMFFWLLAAVSVASALAVIRLHDLFRAALMLVVTFFTVAGLLILLNAEFLAVVQVLIYAGAISVLIIFAVLLTRDVEKGNRPNRLRVPALLASGLIGVFLVFVALQKEWPLLEDVLSKDSLARAEEVFTTTPQWLAGLLLREWVLPFEVASVLLLAAILGAIVLVRERHP
ncbi:MAG: NADH-quinone oxidoreductase subunit J [Dehalococcoidia bacterium]|nr:NADH-quinone oxidoreductase subunit J [Dehalococcoidia bacterium]